MVQGGGEIVGGRHHGRAARYRRRGRSQRVEVDVVVVEPRDEWPAVAVDDLESRRRFACEVRADRRDHTVVDHHVADSLG